MVHLILEGEGLSIKEEISRLQALQILAFVDSNANPNTSFVPAAPVALTQNKSMTQALTGKQESLGEYLRDSGAKTNPEKVLAFAAYYLRTNSEELFAPVDIQRSFERARESMPKNFGRDFRNTIDARWIEESSTESGKYWITKTGEQALADKFVGAVRASKNNSTGVAPKRKATTENVLPSEVLEGMSTVYWSAKLQTDADKIFFILAEAKKHGKEELNTSDINWISDKLGDKPFPGITASLNYHKGKWLKTDLGYKILQPGIAYIEERMAMVAA